MNPRDKNERKFDKSNFISMRNPKNTILHIISAGPSCRNFNWKSIRGQDIMTINDAIFYLPLKVTYHVYNEPVDIEKERYFIMTRKYPFVHKFTTFDVRGWHQLEIYDDKNLAFMIALNLSIDLGYEKVKLYGYDFNCIDGYIHWWDKKPEDNNEIIQNKMKLVLKQKILFDKFKENIEDKIIIEFVEG